MTSDLFQTLLILCLGYLLGSIPSGYLAGRWLAKVDLRSIGSGSTGATNVFRNVGKVPAIAVFVVDVSKGITSILIARYFLLNDLGQVLTGLASLAGHIWPVWLGWKGGKAVATGFGMFLGLSWPVGLACFGIFITIFSITKIVSLSSIIASISLPLLMGISFIGNEFQPSYFIVSVVAMIIIIWRHRSNLKRLLEGEEAKLFKPR